MNNFFVVIDNLKKLLGLKRDVDLFRRLRVSKQTFYTWKNRRNVPAAGLLKISGITGVPIDRLTGEVEKNLLLKEDAAVYNKESIPALLDKAKYILGSNSIYRQALAANINAFDEALSSEKNLMKRVDSLEEENKKTKAEIAILARAIKSRNEIPSPETIVG